jgi:hypothetical protein
MSGCNPSCNRLHGNVNGNFTGSSNTVYYVWASSDLLNWQWLGATAEMYPGQYGFTDSFATPLESFIGLECRDAIMNS